MFSYNYIVPTGPSGYYNYSNQQSTSNVPPQQSCTPPQLATGLAQSYYGTPSPQYAQTAPGTATVALSQLIPAATSVHSSRENGRLAQFYMDFERLVEPPMPNHETRYVATIRDFKRWMNEVYHPKMRVLEGMRTGLEAFQQRLQAFAEESCRLGTAAYNFLTEHLEIGDVFDFLEVVETRLEEIYQELLAMDELKIDIESDTNAADCYNTSKTKYAKQWEEYKCTTKLTARRNFHQARTMRKRAHVEKLAHYVTTADAIDTPPYEAIMKAIAQISAINSQQDVDVLNRADTVLKCARDQGTYISTIRFQAHCALMEHEEIHIPMLDADYAQQSALLQRQQQIVNDMATQANNQKKAVEDHYVQWGGEPVARLVSAYLSAGQFQSATTNCSGATYNNSLQSMASYAPTMSGAPASAAQAAPAPKFQMPLSYYSNALTQQHVTNMQVMNNVGGGSTNFHLANSSGGIIW